MYLKMFLIKMDVTDGKKKKKQGFFLMNKKAF